MSSKRKGRLYERERKVMLESQGYQVELAPVGTRFSKQKDFFTYFDIIAYNNDHWLLEQVKCGGTRGFLKRFNESSCPRTLPPHTRVQLAVRYKNKSIEDRWRIIRLK